MNPLAISENDTHVLGFLQLGCYEDLARRLVYGQKSYTVWVIGPLQCKYLIAHIKQFNSTLHTKLDDAISGYPVRCQTPMLSLLFSMIFNATEDP